jgi:uncharacterized YigZ family protein
LGYPAKPAALPLILQFPKPVNRIACKKKDASQPVRPQHYLPYIYPACLSKNRTKACCLKTRLIELKQECKFLGVDTMPDTYKTVAREMVTECKIQRSLFIAHVQETPTEKEARDFIAQISNKHKQATHNCSAYQIGLGKETSCYFDDNGEPSGTAGKPILGAILSRELTNITVVVTRYFGGKKLGVRGLIDAYGNAAGDALDRAGTITKTIYHTLCFTCNYPQLDQINYLVTQHHGEITESNYTDQVKLKIAVPRSFAAQLKNLLAKYGQIN